MPQPSDGPQVPTSGRRIGDAAPAWTMPAATPFPGVAGRTKIGVHVDRLSLEGLAVEPSQEPVLKASLIRELERLLAGSGGGAHLAANRTLASVRGGDFVTPTPSDPERLGVEIARAAFRGIGR